MYLLTRQESQMEDILLEVMTHGTLQFPWKGHKEWTW